MNLAALVLVGALAMPQPWGSLFRRDHVLVAGMPGCGKTPFAAHLAEAARRAVYFDPTGEWAPLGEVVPGPLLLDADAGDVEELLEGTYRRLVVAPTEDGLVVEFRATVALCRAASHHGGLVLLVDEVGDLTSECSAELLALHRNGHKDGLASVLCSPCMTDFPKRCRDTASRVYSFWQKNSADRAALAAEYGEVFAVAAATWRYPQPPAAWVSPTLHG